MVRMADSSDKELGVVLDAVGPPGFASGHERDVEGVPDSSQPPTRAVDPVWVWGVPFASLSMSEAVSAIGELIEAARPTYVITANVHYAMLSHENPDLRAINDQVAFILADGAPLVWASRWQGSPLPERVAGADLIFELSAEAARKGHRLFLLGGADGVAEEASRRLCKRYPGLKIAGTECPPFRQSTPEEEAALIERIRAAKADILLVAFGQPKGERWISRNLERLAVPVSIQVGASLDFAADRVRRAPRWMQKCGLEWTFRLGLEPRRLFGRYLRNAWFIGRMVARDIVRRAASRTRTPH
jgi:N-acetylglucosaminyldiphosphoundecaprenol N-acetyl-beta-D-mannosaminyltransferase